MLQFSYHVSSATLTVKPKTDNVDEIMTKVLQVQSPTTYICELNNIHVT